MTIHQRGRRGFQGFNKNILSSGCEEPSEMSSVKNTMSLSLIKCINYANNLEKRLNTSRMESNDNLLMIQLFLIQFECLQLYKNTSKKCEKE